MKTGPLQPGKGAVCFLPAPACSVQDIPLYFTNNTAYGIVTESVPGEDLKAGTAGKPKKKHLFPDPGREKKMEVRE